MVTTLLVLTLNPFPNNKILDWSKLNECADVNFKFDENDGKFPKWEETMWEKEKLLVASNFSFSHSAFKRLVLQTHKNQGLFGKGLTLHQIILTFNHPKMEAFENIGFQHFLLFPQCFLPFPKQISIFLPNLICPLQILSIWTNLKICHFVKSYCNSFS